MTFRKLVIKICVSAGVGVIVAITVLLLAPHANASTGGASCQMKSAKNTTVFPAGTEFTIKPSPFRTYTYKCDGSIGQWWETINSSPFPGQVVGGNSGVLSDGGTSSGGTTGPTGTTGGGVLQ